MNMSPSQNAKHVDFENAPCGFLTLTAEGTVLCVNATVTKWLNCSRDEITSKQLKDITGPGTDLYFRMFVFPLLRMQGFVNEVSLDIVAPDGKVTSCLMNATAQTNADGSTGPVTSVLFPISDRKKYEVELLNQKKFAEAVLNQKEQVLFAQRRIMSILGHDTRAPIVSILNIIKLAAAGKASPEEVVPYFDMMATQLQGTLTLINNLLDWANALFDTERNDEQPKPLYIISDEVCGLLEPNAIGKGLELKMDIDTRLLVTTNQSIISFMLRNLVNNAIKFTKQGTVSVSSSAEEDYVKIIVSDTGIGMDERQAARFLTGDLASSNGTSDEKGSGMGLMLIHQYLVQLQGEMTLQTTPGKGSGVTVRLPRSMFDVEQDID